MRAPLFQRFADTLTVDDAGRGETGFARGFLAALEVERMMDAIQRAVPVPQAEVIMHGASMGGKSLGSARHWQPVLRMYIHAVDHLADSDAPFVRRRACPAGSAARYAPIPNIGQVARITQFVAVVARAVIGSPHDGHLKSKFTTPENHS